MRKIYLIIYILIVLLASCNIGNEINNSVTILLNTTRSTLDISSISLTVEAADMDTIEAYSEDSNCISVELTEGDDRTFSIVVTLDNGDILSGSTTEDITSSTSSVSIDIEYENSSLLDVSIGSAVYTIEFSKSELIIDSNSTGSIEATVTFPESNLLDSWSHYIDGDESISNENATDCFYFNDTTSSTYFIIIDGTAYSVGSHELSVIAKIDGDYYSESLYFEVTN